MKDPESSPKPSKKLVTLDYSGTLVDPSYLDYFWLELIPKAAAKRWQIRESLAKLIVLSSYEAIGSDNIKWYLPGYWLDKFGILDQLDELARTAADKAVVYPDAISLYERVKREFVVAIVTNTAMELVKPVLDKSGIRPDLLVSTPNMLGVYRKSPHVYRIVASLAGVKPQCSIHIGDDYEQDLMSPLRAGFEAVLVSRKKRRNPEARLLCLGSLEEAAHLIRELLSGC